MVPLRFVFRSRWAALAWAAGICLTAVRFADGDSREFVNAADGPDGKAAQASALAAEDRD